MFRGSISLITAQRQSIAPSLQRALTILTLPLHELKDYVEEEIVRNPLLKLEESRQAPSFGRRKPLQDKEDCSLAIPDSPSFQEEVKRSLQLEIEESDREIVDIVVGELDERGYLESSSQELAMRYGIEEERVSKIVKKLKSMEPIGVGASSLKECLLLQLEEKGRKGSISYQLLHDYFEELLKGKMAVLSRKLKISIDELYHIIDQEIRPLYFHPRGLVEKHTPHYIIPDLIFEENESKWQIRVEQEILPSIEIDTKIKKLLATSSEEGYFIQHLNKARWLHKNLFKRKALLQKIALFLFKQQRAFFTEGRRIVGSSIKQLADHLEVHPVTAARAVANKYVSTPFGIFPLKFFFQSALFEEGATGATVEGEIRDLIKKENKSSPLTDEEISCELKKRGHTCSRRTVTKYRKRLLIAPMRRRKGRSLDSGASF